MSAYVVYADEAWTHDPEYRFWRFYGGAMLLASEREEIEAELRAVKAAAGLEGEIKWTKARISNWDRVATVVERFLDFVEARRIKMRYLWIDQLKQNPEALNDY